MIAAAYPVLQGMSLQNMLLTLVLRCLRNRQIASDEIHNVCEAFSGARMIALHLLIAGLRGVRFDKKHTDEHDVLSPDGLRL